MISIDSYIQLGLSFFEIPLEVQDMGYTKTDGEDSRYLLGERTLQVAVDPSRSRQLERIFGGSVGDGDIGIYLNTDLNEPLYLADEYSLNVKVVVGEDEDYITVGEDSEYVTVIEEDYSLQSFVTYAGKVYRVSQDSDWLIQLGIKVYLAKRHVSQDLL